MIIGYKGYFEDGSYLLGILRIIRRFLFIGIGIGAHLWYLGALCFSVMLLYVLMKKLNLKQIFAIATLLYIFSLSADTYYGLFSDTIVSSFINIYIKLFGEVWNSFAQGLIFIVIGIMIKKYELVNTIKKPIKIVIISYFLFIMENFIVKYLNIARDNNTSIFLLILAPCIFIALLKLENKYSNKIIKKYSSILKNISMNIYLIHPLVIEVISNVFSIISFDECRYQSYIKFIVVSIISILIALIIEKCKWLKEIKDKRQKIYLYNE